MILYTKHGDNGFSGTLNRINIPKNSPVFELLGTLDEFTSSLGVAKEKASADIGTIIEELQQNLIALSGEIAGGKKFATPEHVARLESAIDSIMTGMPEFEGFILPGKTACGVALDVARTVARRAERTAVGLSQIGGISRDVLMWLNRMSDLTYALARFCDQHASPASPSVPSSALVGSGFCDTADQLCTQIRSYAAEQGVKVVVAVCDAGGNLVALQRADDAYIASIDIAMNKAFTSVSLKMTTEQVGKLAQPGESLYGIQFTNNNRIVIFGGGVPLIKDGVIVGGLGVSGGSLEQDTAIAHYGASIFNK